MKVRVKNGRKKNTKQPKKNRTRSRRHGLSYWMAMGTLMACTTIGSKTPPPVYAQHAGSGWRAVHSVIQVQTPARRFDIPPGPLDTVLGTFQNLTGLRVMAPNESVRSISSPGVSGVYTPE